MSQAAAAASRNRRVFGVITAVWGVAFLLEAALRVVIVYKTSTGTALAISRVTPFLFVALLVALDDRLRRAPQEAG